MSALDPFVDAVARAVAERLAPLLRGEGAADRLLGESDLVPRYFRTRRALSDAVGLRGLVACRAGRALVVRQADLDAWLASRPRRRKPARPAAAAAAADPLRASAAALGLRLVGGRR